MKIWFLLNNGQVTGPMTPDELESQLVKSDVADSLVWGRGRTEWMSPDKWRKDLVQDASRTQAPEADTQQWRLRIEGKERPPQSFKQMIQQLKTVTDYGVIEVKSETANAWREIYSLPEIVNELGITRRSHPRVPVMGNFEYETARGKFVAKAISISEGGLGLTEAPGMVIGEKIKGTLKSPNLFVSITAACDVVYVGSEGYAGLKFANLPPEAKSSIIEYVNKFSI